MAPIRNSGDELPRVRRDVTAMALGKLQDRIRCEVNALTHRTSDLRPDEVKLTLLLIAADVHDLLDYVARSQVPDIR